MLRGGRDPLYPRPSEPRPSDPEYPRDEPEPRFSAPAPERASEDDRPDSSAEDDDRGVIGENFCHPPLLAAPPPSRPEEPIEFPPLDSAPTFELPRVSAVDLDPALSPGRPASCMPGSEARALPRASLPRFSVPRFSAERFSVLRLSAPRFTGEMPFCRIAFETCACSRSNERPLAAVVVPCVEKNR